MLKPATIFGAMALAAGFAALVFSVVHPMDIVVQAILFNAVVLLYGIALVILVSRFLRDKEKQLRITSFPLLLLAGFYLFSLLFTNMNFRSQALRANLLSEPLAKVLRMKGVTYEWKRDEFKGENFPEGRVSGVIAQEMEQVLPQLVGTRKDGYKGVAYQEIVPILIEAVKEQQKLIDRQKSEIQEIKTQVQRMRK